jgi:hypothetical protein
MERSAKVPKAHNRTASFGVRVLSANIRALFQQYRESTLSAGDGG